LRSIEPPPYACNTPHRAGAVGRSAASGLNFGHTNGNSGHSTSSPIVFLGAPGRFKFCVFPAKIGLAFKFADGRTQTLLGAVKDDVLKRTVGKDG
jgi:hypothetical protein